jgi:hypothetical protein
VGTDKNSVPRFFYYLFCSQASDVTDLRASARKVAELKELRDRK